MYTSKTYLIWNAQSLSEQWLTLAFYFHPVKYHPVWNPLISLGIVLIITFKCLSLTRLGFWKSGKLFYRNTCLHNNKITFIFFFKLLMSYYTTRMSHLLFLLNTCNHSCYRETEEYKNEHLSLCKDWPDWSWRWTEESRALCHGADTLNIAEHPPNKNKWCTDLSVLKILLQPYITCWPTLPTQLNKVCVYFCYLNLNTDLLICISCVFY